MTSSSVVLQVALQQAHRLGRHHRHLSLGACGRRAGRPGPAPGPAAGRRWRPAGPGRPPAPTGRRSSQKRVASPSAAAKTVRRIISRSAAGRQFVVASPLEGRQVGEMGRVLAGHLELGLLAADHAGARRRPRWSAPRRALRAGLRPGGPPAGSPRRAPGPSGRARPGGCPAPGRWPSGCSGRPRHGLEVLQDRLPRRAPARPRWPAGTADNNPSR